MKGISLCTTEGGISFILKRQKRKSISLSVAADRQVMVRAPLQMSDRSILSFVDSKKRWISKQIEKQENRIHLPVLEAAEKERIRILVKNKALAWLEEIDGPKPERVFVRFSKSRWGTCSSLNNISLNGYLYFLPDELFFYVLCHELTHLQHMNHSPLFWNALTGCLPNARALEKSLRGYRLPM